MPHIFFLKRSIFLLSITSAKVIKVLVFICSPQSAGGLQIVIKYYSHNDIVYEKEIFYQIPAELLN